MSSTQIPLPWLRQRPVRSNLAPRAHLREPLTERVIGLRGLVLCCALAACAAPPTTLHVADTRAPEVAGVIERIEPPNGPTSTDPAPRPTAMLEAPADDELALPVQQKERKVSFFVAVYGWLASIDGDAVANGTETPISVPFDDILDNTNSGLMLYAEARWKRWFAAFDGTWVQLGGDNDGILLDLDATVDQRIYDLRIGRELQRKVLEESNAEQSRPRELVTDLFVGARYFSTDVNVNLVPIIGTPSTVSLSDERWDPIIGGRVAWDASQRWAWALRGDIGGFGIGDAAQFTWQLEGTVALRLASWSQLIAGYRVLAFDTVEGDGAARAGSDLLQHGFIFGAGFGF